MKPSKAPSSPSRRHFLRPGLARICTGASAHGIEALENRLLLSALFWTGGGDGVNWTDVRNWSTGAVPAAADDVTINIGGNPGIQLASGVQAIHSLTSTQPLKITGGTLSVATTAQFSGNLNLAGGTLLGGTYTSSGAGSLAVTAQSTLDGVALGSNLTVQGASLHVLHGLMIDASLTLSGPISQPASVLFDDTQSLSGTGEVVFASANASFATGYAGGGGPITLTIGSGITVHGAAGAGAFDTVRAFQPDQIVNLGTISADVPGQTITLNAINGQQIVNQGTMTATAGTLDLLNVRNAPGATIAASGAGTVLLAGTWTNAGTLSSSNGTINLGGTFKLAALGTFNRSGGAVNLSGALNNVGGTLALTAATGSWNLANGGSIIGGTVTASGGASLQITGAGTLDGVTLDTDVTVPSTFLSIRDGLTLNAALTANEDASIGFVGTQTLSGTGRVLLAGHTNGDSITLFMASGAPTLTIGPSITISGAPGAAVTTQIAGTGTLVNQGTISEVAGQTIHFAVTTLVNQGSVLASAAGARVNANVKSLTLGAGSKLDLGIGSLTVDYSGGADPLASLRSSLSAGTLFSSAADASHRIGYGDSADNTIQGLGPSMVLLKYAVVGDANLDGQVGFADLVALAGHYGSKNANWDQGDFTGNGTVSFTDLVALASNYGRTVSAGAVQREAKRRAGPGAALAYSYRSASIGSSREAFHAG